MQLNKKAIAAVSFLMCIAVGFGVTKLVKKLNDSTNDVTETPVVERDTPLPNTPTIKNKKVSEETVADNTPTKIPDVIASLDAKPEKALKKDKKKEKKVEEKKEVEEVEEVIVEPKMSLSEIRNMLRRGDFVGTDKLSPNFNIHTSGMRSGERTPESPMDVHDKLRTEQWKDFAVVNADYDDMGRVSSVTIRPVYQSEEKRVAF